MAFWLWPYGLIAGNDLALQHYPWQVLLREMVAAGQFPFWNPYTFGGVPAFANPPAHLVGDWRAHDCRKPPLSRQLAIRTAHLTASIGCRKRLYTSSATVRSVGVTESSCPANVVVVVVRLLVVTVVVNMVQVETVELVSVAVNVVVVPDFMIC